MSSASFDDAALRLATVASFDGAIITQDLAGTITSWNRAAEQIFGQSAFETVGQSIGLIVPPELQGEQDEMLQRIRTGESFDHYDTVRLRQDGQRIDVSLTILPLATADGQIVGASQIARVITEHQRLERDARHLVAIVESSGDAIISKDLNGTITSWNRAAEKLFGYSVAEAIGQSVRLIIPADRLAEEDGVLHGVRQGEVVDHFETVRLRKDGTLVPISLTVSPIRSATGEIIGISKIARDLTVTRRQEALLQAGALQRAIFNSANFSSIATDAKGVIQIFNVGAERMLGYATADVKDKITPADISDPLEVIARAKALSVELSTPITPGFEALVFKASRGIEDIYELTYIRKDGSRFPAVVSVTALRDAQDAIIGYLLIGTDNTARKHAEEALLKAGALQRAIFNSANFSSIATDAKGVIQIFNVGAERMLGYAAANVVNQITPADISDPDEVIIRAKALSVELGTPITPGFEALVFKASRGIEDIYELTYFRKDGSRFPAVVSVTALRDAQDVIIGYLLIGTDNTARKQAEDTLLKAGALQRAIFNSANFSSIATDAKGVIQIFNVGAERMLGYAAIDVMNQITPADISDSQELIARAKALSVELGTPITPGFEALVFKASRGIEDIYELTYIRKDGSRFPAVVSVTALRDPQNTIIGYLLIGTDNTARKQAEEALLKAGALQRAIFNSANFSSIATDAKGVIQIFNVGAERMLGYTAADVMNKITPADISDPQEVIARAKALSVELATPITPGFEALVFKASRGIEDIYELTYIRKDGSRFPAVVSVTALRDAQDTIIGYLLIGTDNTTRKQAEEALRLAAIVDSTDDGIISKDLDGVITSWNRAAERMFGFSSSEIVGQSIRCLIPDDLQDEEDHVLSRIRRGERVEHYETVRRRKDGTIIPVSLTVSPIRNVDGIVIGASKIVRDISERKRAEDERRRLLTVAQVKSEFLANMSHELRTPLNAIIGFAELMHRGKVGPVSAEHQEYLGDILTSSQHLLQLINDVLDLAKVESGKMEFRLESVDLPKLTREVCDIVRGLAASGRLQVDTHVDPEVSTVVVDPARVKQILYNYLSNAIKFTPPGGRITIRILPEGPALFRIDVEDSGVGIAANDLGKLFVEFQQLDASAAKTYQGTGLGLALTKKLAEAHGGRVAVRSTPGQGSMFSVILPREMTMVPDEEVAGPAVDLPDGNRTILVVDDDPAALKIASLALREMGYRPVCSADPEDALRTVAADPPGIVIVDLLMPGVDGFEFVSRFRAMPAGRDVPIIVWTVKDLDTAERRRLQPSIAAIVSKNAGGSHALVEELQRLLLAECVAPKDIHGE